MDDYLSDALLVEALDDFEARAMPYLPTCFISSGFCPTGPLVSTSIDNTVHSGYATSPYTPIWSVAVCATDVTDVSKDYKWLLALQCTKTAENIAGNV